jgi:hypothetical protein
VPETVLIDSYIKNSMALLTNLVRAECEIRGDSFIQSLDSKFNKASEEDWGMNI